MSSHAVDAFRRRAHGAHRLSWRAALAVMVKESWQAHFVKVLDTGAELWRGPPPRRLRYLVTNGDPLPVCMTVLGPHDGAT